jgi:bifunctional DNA-binding transcriptional regulator/antitoxin component of YhaV-PrlF toxin-antitoxin module
MEVTTERLKKGGIITIPQSVLDYMGLAEGDEVLLRGDGRRLVIEPVIKRKRLALSFDIVDKLVEQEDLFEPEVQ